MKPPMAVFPMSRVEPMTRYLEAGAIGQTATGFYRRHLFVPLLACALLGFCLLPLHGDLRLADWLYSIEGDRWTLRDGFITETLIHEAGRDMSAAAWLCVLSAWLASRFHPWLTPWRRPLAYLAGSTLTAALLVTWIKSGTNVDCPWDLARYGGQLGYVGLFEPRPAYFPDASCFPAGHASAGYAWVSLYFFLLPVRPRLRWFGLATGLGLGLLFGAAQQLRGAHFLSHDLTTLMVCWLTAFGLHVAMLRRPPVIGL